MKEFVKHGSFFETSFSEEYKKHVLHLGSSDIAQLTMLGCKTNGGAVPVPLKFGGDGAYQAWLVDDPALIPSHYELVDTFEFECEFFKMDGSSNGKAILNTWLKVYDDSGLSCEVVGKRISVYRAGDYGCLICVEKGVDNE